MKHIGKFVAAAITASAFALPAHATLLSFAITGDYTASFQIDSNPAPAVRDSGRGFVILDVEGNFPGALAGIADLTFYNSALGGGLYIYDFYADSTLLLTDGPQLYSGSEDAPIFNTGTFALSDFSGTGTYTLTISNPNVAAVPEPATWGMMILGFGMIGAASRSRKVKTSVKFA